MGSVQDYIKCPECAGVAFNDFYYKTGEEYTFCKRCGLSETWTIKRNDEKQPMFDKKGRLQLEHNKEKGYGVYRIMNHEGFGQYGCFNEPITDEVIEDFRKIFQQDDVDEESSYLAKWEDGEQTILLGKLLEPFSYDIAMLTMDFDDFMNMVNEKANEPKHISAYGLEQYTVEEFSEIVNNYLRQTLNFVEDDFAITQISLVGSRMKGTHREDSDLDIAIQYEGRYRSDSMCDVLNGEPLEIEGIRIDFVPYARYKGEMISNDAPIEHLPITSFPAKEFTPDITEDMLPF